MNSRSLGPPLSVSSPSCNHIVRCDALEFDSFTLCIDDLHPTMISISTNHAPSIMDQAWYSFSIIYRRILFTNYTSFKL